MKRHLFGAVLVLVLAACQEQLSSPADCPALCPGGTSAAIDTVLSPLAGLDSTYDGYVPARNGGSTLITTAGLPFQARGVIRFTSIPDSVTIGSTKRGYTIDSVAVNFAVAERDTSVRPVALQLYRIASRPDTSFTYDQAVAAEAGGATVTVPFADTLRTGTARVVLTGAQVTPLAIPALDSGSTAFAIGVSAPTPTGVRILNTAATNYVWYVNAIGADSATRKQVLTANPSFFTYVAAPRGPAPSGSLVVGGEPSSRSVLRFRLPPVVRDSASIVRATLELVPNETLSGVPNLGTVLQARPVLTDLGAKSVLDANSIGVVVKPGSSDTVRVEIAKLVQLWQGRTGRQQTVFLQVSPEGAAWIRFAFGSTAGPRAPRLRITYLKPFPFEAP